MANYAAQFNLFVNYVFPLVYRIRVHSLTMHFHPLITSRSHSFLSVYHFLALTMLKRKNTILN